MRDITTLKPIGSAHCTQYDTEAKFYIEIMPAGERQLVVHYEKGGYQGAQEFVTGIPDEWTDQNVIDLIMWPMKSRESPYPSWEVPAKVVTL